MEKKNTTTSAGNSSSINDLLEFKIEGIEIGRLAELAADPDLLTDDEKVDVALCIQDLYSRRVMFGTCDTARWASDPRIRSGWALLVTLSEMAG